MHANIMSTIPNRLCQAILAVVTLLASTTAQAGMTFTYTHTDAQGSVVAITDQNQQVIERRAYEPYGLPQVQPDTDPDPDVDNSLKAPGDGETGYTSHVHDADSGLVYMQQRYYDPATGQFLSIDPVGVSPSTGSNFNRYAYASNNPYRYIDPDGRMSCDHIGKARCDHAKGMFAFQLEGADAPIDAEWTPEDQMAVEASDAAYEDDTGGLLNEFGISTYDFPEGFSASLTMGADGRYILAYRGSDGNDGGSNTRQALGLGSSQYDYAVRIATVIYAATGGNVLFTGHSAGGGMASAAAEATGGRAITFNAAGLSSRYRTGNAADIRAHFIRGDFLNILQGATPLPDAIGRQLSHPGTGSPVERHRLEQFLH